jgi:aspartate-semialdehyde dehydrogenase
MSFNVAIVGATGAVGQEFLTVLAERKFPIKSLRLLASPRSAGKRIQFGGATHTVEELTKTSFRDVQFAFFSAGGASAGSSRRRR